MSYNILLVDDDKIFREEFQDSFYEYNIIEASNGEEALEILKKPNIIDLVFLDVKMPGLSGTKILKKIKEMNPLLNIFILTGYSTKDVAIESLKAHADDYIEKPLDVDKTKKYLKIFFEKKILNGELNSIDNEGKIEKVKEIAERNYNKKLSLKEVADIICLSPKYLSRMFKEITGIGFNEFKLNVKVKKSKELLLNTGYNIDQISYDMGYQNVESFIRIFKKITGFTPTEFREIERNKNNEIKKS